MIIRFQRKLRGKWFRTYKRTTSQMTRNFSQELSQQLLYIIEIYANIKNITFILSNCLLWFRSSNDHPAFPLYNILHSIHFTVWFEGTRTLHSWPSKKTSRILFCTHTMPCHERAHSVYIEPSILVRGLMKMKLSYKYWLYIQIIL